jgi:hypothetical protein
MSLPRSVADVLKDHVTLEVEGIDRMDLNVYVPVSRVSRRIGSGPGGRFPPGDSFVSPSGMRDSQAQARLNPPG